MTDNGYKKEEFKKYCSQVQNKLKLENETNGNNKLNLKRKVKHRKKRNNKHQNKTKKKCDDLETSDIALNNLQDSIINKMQRKNSSNGIIDKDNIQEKDIKNNIQEKDIKNNLEEEYIDNDNQKEKIKEEVNTSV
jgi:hypothetical protein